MKPSALKENKKVTSIESEAYWKKHIEQLAVSNITRKEYCQQHDVNYDRFGYWLGRLKKPTIAAAPPLIAVKLQSTPLPSIPENKPSLRLCSLELRDGRMLHIHHEQALLLLLERC